MKAYQITKFFVPLKPVKMTIPASKFHSWEGAIYHIKYSNTLSKKHKNGKRKKLPCIMQ